MLNPEMLLGKMLNSTMKKGSKKGKSNYIGGAAKGALAMGALGVAIAAFDHFTQKQSSAAVPQYQPNQPITPPPQHYHSIGAGQTPVMPPPPPGTSQPAADPNIQAESILLIKAMIAAANADGVLDAAERQNILNKLNEEELTAEEKQFISGSIERLVGKEGKGKGLLIRKRRV